MHSLYFGPTCGGSGCALRLAVGSPILAEHTKAAHSQQHGQQRMWPPSSFCWPDIPQQPRPVGPNTIHNTSSHPSWGHIHSPGWGGGHWPQCFAAGARDLVLHAPVLKYLLFLGFFVLPVEFDFIHQMRGIMGTILENESKTHKALLTRLDSSDSDPNIQNYLLET